MTLNVFYLSSFCHDREANLFSFFLVFLQLHYRYDYNVNIKGTNTAPAVTVDTERARLANYIQSDVRHFHLIFSGLILNVPTSMYSIYPASVFMQMTAL